MEKVKVKRLSVQKMEMKETEAIALPASLTRPVVNYLPTALATEVMQLPSSVCLFVSTLSLEPTTGAALLNEVEAKLPSKSQLTKMAANYCIM